MITVAFVDDHPVLLAGLVGLLTPKTDLKVVGVGNCADDVTKIVNEAEPDVIVIDLNMPGNTLDSIAQTVKSKKATRVLVFTASVAVDHAISALEAGATGFVIKGSPEEELLTAIRAVSVGESYISAGFASKVVAGLRSASLRRAATETLRLSVREEQILRLLLLGKTNREIATALSLSDKTIKHYMTILMQRLNVRNRIEVVLAAQELGIDVGGSAGKALH